MCLSWQAQRLSCSPRCGISGCRAAAFFGASTEHPLRNSAGWMPQPETEFIGISAAIRHVEVEMDYSARSDAKVLITGESGVGKEIAARLIHQRSRRAHLPVVTINCAGIPDSLLESELFGHVRGSFTNAYRDRLGLLEMADGGTIFMDEVGEMSLRMQALLLRFLETGEIQRV